MCERVRNASSGVETVLACGERCVSLDCGDSLMSPSSSFIFKRLLNEHAPSMLKTKDDAQDEPQLNDESKRKNK